mmetsp:Transcript_14295/g.31312  ORF Transcript_14295/g.31312 Transcript_14295/m.31312 type:complete len:216 (-) Transcript_14295:81-728(-)
MEATGTTAIAAPVPRNTDNLSLEQSSGTTIQQPCPRAVARAARLIPVLPEVPSTTIPPDGGCGREIGDFKRGTRITIVESVSVLWRRRREGCGRAPSFSAATIIACAMRSFPVPPGLRHSILTKRRWFGLRRFIDETRDLSSTSGVFPMAAAYPEVPFSEGGVGASVAATSFLFRVSLLLFLSRNRESVNKEALRLAPAAAVATRRSEMPHELKM